MTTIDLVKCNVCGFVGYPRRNGTPRNHPVPGEGRANDRPTCQGSGLAGTPVERVR